MFAVLPSWNEGPWILWEATAAFLTCVSGRACSSLISVRPGAAEDDDEVEAAALPGVHGHDQAHARELHAHRPRRECSGAVSAFGGSALHCGEGAACGVWGGL